MKTFDTAPLLRWKVVCLLWLFSVALCLPGRCVDRMTVKPLGNGVYLKHFHYDNLYDSPQEIFVVDADLNVSGVALQFPHLTAGARATVSDFALKTPGAVAVINGQFFDAKGSIQFLKVDGKVINETQSAGVHDQQAIAVDNRSATHILRKPQDGWSSLTSIPNLMASGMGLIVNGERVAFDPADATYSKRHPRTCVAMTANNHLLLIVIDGRTKNAAGQTGAEMQSTLLGLASITNAFNFDGGGSTTLWATGSVVNQPSGGVQRPVANAVALFAMPYSVNIQSITMSAIPVGRKKRARVEIKVVDVAGLPVEGVTVTGDFAGATSNANLNARTNSDGTATITSTSDISHGVINFRIESITGANLIWDSAANKSARLRLPKKLYRR